jgi:hypothetical protein
VLNNIDKIIEKEVKKDLLKFNPEMNEELRTKLLSSNASYIPKIEEKFLNFMENFIKLKKEVIEKDTIKKSENANINDSDSEKEDSIDLIFKEEKSVIKKVMNYRK